MPTRTIGRTFNPAQEEGLAHPQSGFLGKIQKQQKGTPNQNRPYSNESDGFSFPSTTDSSSMTSDD
jgi:hypothetical protein